MMIINQSKYVLTGGPCTGKTTLLNALEGSGYQIIPEVAQLVVKEFLKNGPLPKWDSKNTTEFQKIFLRIHTSLEARLKGTKLCFFDRSFIDTIAYCKFYNNKPLKALTHLAKTNRFSMVFFLNFLPFYKKTTIRQESLNTAKKIHHLIKETYQEFGYKLIDVPASNIQQRCEFIHNKINKDIPLNLNIYNKQHLLNI